ncbi:universal stress protein [Williamsia sterculiae]|uniref:Nucleotide-binding universal stress protein, UspA family n=1 Tax=Williamsia sterculiae TaxID=1344003 RepID=A0A1N7FWQ3_9NOCA|nr:universal stress protein [Williamsia sterculiae]SIS04739.1 Nucleotide-binding universal stress protein, UspA family [Williamsia sterculiae]
MNVVIGYDEHPASLAALRTGATLARGQGATIWVVHVADINDEPVDPDSADYEGDTADRLAHHRATVSTLLDADRHDWSYQVVHGPPAPALMRIAETLDAALLVVGRPEHGLTALLDHTMSGAVSRELLRHATCPVLIVPENRSWQ